MHIVIDKLSSGTDAQAKHVQRHSCGRISKPKALFSWPSMGISNEHKGKRKKQHVLT
jgi:hypothetical protein